MSCTSFLSLCPLQPSKAASSSDLNSNSNSDSNSSGRDVGGIKEARRAPLSSQDGEEHKPLLDDDEAGKGKKELREGGSLAVLGYLNLCSDAVVSRSVSLLPRQHLLAPGFLHVARVTCDSMAPSTYSV